MSGVEVRIYEGFYPLKAIVEKTLFWEKNSEKNLEKDSPYVLLVIPGDEGLHTIVKLVHVQ